MSQAEIPAPGATSTAPLEPTSPPESPAHSKKPVARHPFRVYGYKVSHDWLLEFGRDRGLLKPSLSDASNESTVFMYLMGQLPGLQRHFLDDPSEAEYGWCHCLGIANNWNAKKRSRVAERLPTWKAVLGTEEEPRWYMPTTHTIPYVPSGYPVG